MSKSPEKELHDKLDKIIQLLEALVNKPQYNYTYHYQSPPSYNLPTLPYYVVT